jgi:hypothetical protein
MGDVVVVVVVLVSVLLSLVFLSLVFLVSLEGIKGKMDGRCFGVWESWWKSAWRPSLVFWCCRGFGAWVGLVMSEASGSY